MTANKAEFFEGLFALSECICQGTIGAWGDKLDEEGLKELILVTVETVFDKLCEDEDE